MELDELKSKLRQRMEAHGPEVGTAALGQLLLRRKATAIEKVQLQMLLESVFAVAMVLVFGGALFFVPSPILWVAGGLGVLFTVVQLGYFWVEYRRLGRLAHAEGNLRDNLERCIYVLEGFLKLYFRATMWSMPFAFVLGGFAGANLGYRGIEDPLIPINDGDNFWVSFGLSLFVCVLLVLGTYFGLKWYLRRFYGRHLAELRACLKELETEQ